MLTQAFEITVLYWLRSPAQSKKCQILFIFIESHLPTISHIYSKNTGKLQYLNTKNYFNFPFNKYDECTRSLSFKYYDS